MNQPLALHVPRWLLHRLKTEALLPGYMYSLEAAVLFSDMTNVATLVEATAQHSPENIGTLQQTLDRLFGAFVETITSYGGDVVHFRSDAVTAFWRPTNNKNTAVTTALLRAATTARALQEIMTGLDLPESLDAARPALRIGLGFGSVTMMVVGDVQQQRLVFFGPALNRAKSAAERAPSGRVALHETVQWRVATEVAYDADRVLTQLESTARPAPSRPLPTVPLERLCPFFHPALAERLTTDQESHLTHFFHNAVSMFVAFSADHPAAIQEYVIQATGVIEKHNGYLAEILVGELSKRLTVLFGAPVSGEDNSSHAAACALDLATLPGTQAIGTDSGTLFTGVVGAAPRRQYIVAGAEMKRGERLK